MDGQRVERFAEGSQELMEVHGEGYSHAKSKLPSKDYEVPAKPILI